MTRRSMVEYAEAIRGRYGAAGRKEKQRILDEFCETTGMHRKAAIRLLNRERGPAAGRRGRPRRYGPEVGEALVRVWEVGDRMCSKLLVAVMPDLVDALERHGELQLTAELRTQLMEISAASIDRLLRRHRRGLGLQPRRPSTPVGSLKSEIPVRTWSEWTGVEVGSLQADLVLHCGESTDGFYLTTLCAVEVATGWTETLLGQLYPLLSLQLNFFRPIRKIVAKERAGARVLKRYDQPRTAYQRLIESGALSEKARAEVDATLLKINPASLQRRIDTLLRQLWSLGNDERKLAQDLR